MSETKVKAGEVINFSQGCYSDYGYCGNVVIRKDFDLMNAKEEFKIFCKDLDEWNICASEFVTWMVTNLYVAPMESREIHLGEYSEILGESTYEWGKQ